MSALRLPVETARLIVRRMCPGDLADFLAYQIRPDVCRYMPIEPLSEERARGFLERMETAEPGPDGGYLAFAVEHRADGKMIGEVGIAVVPKQQKGELGWSFHPDYHGQGYAIEAARVLLRIAFEDFDLRRVTTFCDTENHPSYRLMERLRMRREGHSRQSQLIRGEWRDEYQYALLRDEWKI